jgi:hypothetical protein
MSATSANSGTWGWNTGVLTTTGFANSGFTANMNTQRYFAWRDNSAPTTQRDFTMRIVEGTGVVEWRSYDDVHSASTLQFSLNGPTSAAAGTFETFGSLAVDTVGQGLQIKEGSNAKQGTATLVAGTVTVTNTSMTANSRIFLTRTALNSTPAVGILCVTAQTAATSFVVTSETVLGATATTDVGSFNYEIFEPAP